MIRKLLLSFVFFISIHTVSFAQNDLKARLEYDEAVKAFEAKDYKNALQRTLTVEELMGWIPKVSFVKIQSLEQMADYANLSDPITKMLNEEVLRYLEYTNKQNPDDVVMDKFKAVYETDQKLKLLRDEGGLITEYGKKYEQFKQNRKNYLEMPEYIEGQKAEEEKDYKKAVEWYKKLDKKQNPEAFHRIARIAAFKESYGINESEAVQYYLKAIELGDLEAILWLTMILDDDNLKQENKAEAFKWLKIASENGIKDCYTSLARAYEYGKGTAPKNYEKALYWYSKDADAGGTFSMRQIAEYYYYGKGVTKSEAECFKWYKKAADAGDGRALHIVGGCYEMGYYGVKKNNSEALKYYMKAAEEEYELAYRELGVQYKQGTITPKNLEESFKWFKKSAEAGDKYGMLQLGNAYHDGEGTTRNYEEAFIWYTKSANEGVASAMKQLALMYKEGNGVKKDKKISAEWTAKYEAAQTKK